MKLISRMLVKSLEAKLLESRSNIAELVNKNLVYKSLFTHLLPTVRDVFSQAYYWHGTGLFHYQPEGDTKYQGIKKHVLVNVLENIIKEGGLLPHSDPWIKTNGEFSKSVSVTSFRLYARLYSELHMFSPDKLSFTYGRREDIAKFFINYTLSEASLQFKALFILAAFFDRRYNSKGSDWAKTINSQVVSRGNSISDFIEIVGKTTSNIPQNFGILIGVKKTALKPAKINKYFGLFETRTRDIIPLSGFTHIEAPLLHVQTVEDLLMKYKIQLPVIPLEIGELYFSQKSTNSAISFLN